MTSDEKWMRRALALAEKGSGRVHPNPMVGAVLVRGDRVVGEGYHRQFGGPHAEVEALQKAGNKARGSTLYVTLEPCAHYGKTPPCALAVREAGIRRVVAAMKDPNPLVSGKGFRLVKKGGASVTIGVLEKEARYLNRAFMTWMTRKRPYVTLKVASSLDGRTSTITGESKWITGEKARSDGHGLRGEADAIAVGSQTVLSDNPTLTAHARGRNPLRVIFASRLKVPLSARVFNREAESLCVVTDHTLLRRMDDFKKKGVQVLLCRAGRTGLADIRDALTHLAARGVAHLLVEGGLTLQQSFLSAGVVDEVVWYLAPMIIGNAKKLKNAQRLEAMDVAAMGLDLRVRACLPESSKRSAK